ncbi:MAG: rRNA pseudouridine synthase [Clostridiales bacterium]|nr:rRNA pseudouridine synthase [Clostridiales bacterium]
MEGIRLNSYIARCGVASRRKADCLIRDGHVFVNGEKVSDMGIKVTTKDVVKVDGKIIKMPCDKVYILLNKPTGVITSCKDQFDRPTVIDIVGDIGVRLHTVGRLDYDTSGLIILTNDGELTNMLTHPKYHVEKTYVAKVKGQLTNQDVYQLENGIVIDDEYKTLPARIKILQKNKDTTRVKIVIREGKNRQIRKMFKNIGHKVLLLERVQIGNIKINDLKKGEFRYLSKQEAYGIIKPLSIS